MIKCGAKGTVRRIQSNLNDMQRGWLIKIQGINRGKSSRWQMEIKKDEVMEEEGEEVKMRRMAETTAASLNSFSPLVLQVLLPENVTEKHRKTRELQMVTERADGSSLFLDIHPRYGFCYLLPVDSQRGKLRLMKTRSTEGSFRVEI